MDTLFNQIAKTVEKIVLDSLTEQLNYFAQNVVELPEMKEMNVTVDQVLECWNSNSDFKVEVLSSPVNNASTSTTVSRSKSFSNGETPSRKPRAQTDKSRKCQVPKQRGDNKGEPCDKNCVVGTEFCPEHLKKNQPASASSRASSSHDESGTAEVCSHVLQNGPNKGNPCGKKITSGSWCTVHAKKH